MQRIVQYLIKFNGVFIFLVLEITALYFYFTRNETDQKHSFLNSASELVGGAYNYSSQVQSCWSLARTSQELAKKNAQLKMRLSSAQYKQLANPIEAKDTVYGQQFKYTAALVVNNSINNPNNFITLNRGAKHGLKGGCGVVNSIKEGIVGITRKVSDHYCVVMSVLNKTIKISSKLKSNNHFGLLTWDGRKTNQMILESIPKHAKIHKGDTVITSGFSTIFPEGILIGTIDSAFIESGSNFYTAYVNLFVDVKSIQYVHVVSDLMKEERKKLEEEVSSG